MLSLFPVIAFCVGTALFTSLLGIFTGETFEQTEKNPLNVIANSFSNGAVFFVSYTILVIATQCKPFQSFVMLQY